MSTKLNPKSVSVSEAARWFGVRRQTLTEWLHDMGIDYAEGVSVPDVIRRKIEHEKRAAIEKAREELGVGAEGDGEGMSENEAKRRNAVATALIREHDYAVKKGNVVPQDGILQAVGDMFAIARSRLLAVPGASAPDIALMEDPVEIAEKLREDIDAALSSLDEEEVKRR